MNNLLTTLLLLFFAQFCMANKDTLITYHAYNGEETKKRDASFIRKTYTLPDGHVGVIELNTRNVKRKQTTYKTAAKVVKDGPFIEYSWDGRVLREGLFANNEQEGEWKFYDQWRLTSKGKFEAGKKVGVWEYYDQQGRLVKKCSYKGEKLDGSFETWQNGQPIDKGFFIQGMPFGQWTSWYSSGQKKYEGTYATGKKTGTWLAYYETGELRMRIDCDSSNIKKRTFYAKAGHEIEYTGAIEEVAQYDGGEEKMFRFIQQNVQYPNEAKEKNEQGSVYVSFVIMIDGSVTDIKIIKGVSDSLDAEAVRVIKKMPNWIPAQRYGIPVQSRCTLPITFRLG